MSPPEMLCLDDSGSAFGNQPNYDYDMQPHLPFGQEKPQAKPMFRASKHGKSITLRWMAEFTKTNNKTSNEDLYKRPPIVSVITMRKNDTKNVIVIGKVVFKPISNDFKPPFSLKINVVDFYFN